MESYKIKVGATSLYLKNENSSTRVAKFIAENEGKKIFVHGLNEDDENSVIVSKYENWEKNEIPVDLLEKFEEIKEETTESKGEEEKNETEANKYILFIEKNKMIIIGIVIGIFISIFSSHINLNNLKTNIAESNYGSVIQTGTGYLETLNQRNTTLDKKENFEIEKQKRVREEKRKAIEQYDAEINSSIEEVKTIRKEKDEISKQKLEFAQ